MVNLALVFGDVCYVNTGSSNSYSWRLFTTTSNPCQCTRLDYVSKNGDEKVVLTDKVDEIRRMMRASCQHGERTGL